MVDILIKVVATLYILFLIYGFIASSSKPGFKNKRWPEKLSCIAAWNFSVTIVLCVLGYAIYGIYVVWFK